MTTTIQPIKVRIEEYWPGIKDPRVGFEEFQIINERVASLFIRTRQYKCMSWSLSWEELEQNPVLKILIWQPKNCLIAFYAMEAAASQRHDHVLAAAEVLGRLFPPPQRSVADHLD